jgi:hypothetical protein
MKPAAERENPADALPCPDISQHQPFNYMSMLSSRLQSPAFISQPLPTITLTTACFSINSDPDTS